MAGRLRLPLIAIGLLASFFWLYWPVFTTLAQAWASSERYSHGYLVPVFAAVLLVLRWDRLREADLRPSWWGLVPLAAGMGLRLVALKYYLAWLDQVSFLVVLVGICLAIGGWPALRRAWVAIAFLFFMIPLPGRLDGQLTRPLQALSTVASANLLQTLGFCVQPEGTTILLNETDLEIGDACSGLRMILALFAISTAVALLSHRSLLQRFLIILAAVPNALLCNVVRICVMAIGEELGSEQLRGFVHDAAGWLMIPLGLLFIGAELKLLGHLFVPAPQPLDLAGAFLHVDRAESREVLQEAKS
jgi:exosortase